MLLGILKVPKFVLHWLTLANDSSLYPYHAYEHGHCNQHLTFPPQHLLPHFLPTNCPHNGHLHHVDLPHSQYNQNKFHLHFFPPQLLFLPQLQYLLLNHTQIGHHLLPQVQNLRVH